MNDEPDVTKRKRLMPMGRLRNGKIESVDPHKITEDVKYSWYSSPSHLHPLKETTVPNPAKNGAYSWLKAPRYDGEPYEVGPLARIMLAYESKSNPVVIRLVDDSLKSLQLQREDLYSVMGRHLARAIECKALADELSGMIMQVKLDEPVCADYQIPESAEGMGLWCAPRGALGHWIQIKEEKIAHYQAVVPTTWNASPKDDKGVPGPIENALLGTVVEDAENPFALARIVRSFDPCIACAVHLIERGKEEKRFRIV